MTEAEILEQITSNGYHLVTNVQYWTSICFAVLVATYLTKGKVNGLIVSVFLIFYVGFSLTIFRTMWFDNEIIRGGLRALEELSDSGEALSPISHAMIEHAPLNNPSLFNRITGMYTIAGMFLLTLAYPVFCIFSSKKEDA